MSDLITKPDEPDEEEMIKFGKVTEPMRVTEREFIAASEGAGKNLDLGKAARDEAVMYRDKLANVAKDINSVDNNRKRAIALHKPQNDFIKQKSALKKQYEALADRQGGAAIIADEYQAEYSRFHKIAREKQQELYGLRYNDLADEINQAVLTLSVLLPEFDQFNRRLSLHMAPVLTGPIRTVISKTHPAVREFKFEGRI